MKFPNLVPDDFTHQAFFILTFQLDKSLGSADCLYNNV